MELSGLLNKMVIFVVLMVIGYVLARRGTADAAFIRTANRLIINVFMTATILNSVFTTEVALSWGKLGLILLVLTVTELLGVALAVPVARLVPIDPAHKPQLELLITFGNNMFIALPVAEELFGSVGVFYCALSCLPFNVLLYTYGVLRLKSGKEKGGLRFRDILSVPLLATVLSLVIFVSKVPIPGVIRSLAGTLSGATMPMSMIVIGASLGSVSLLDAFKSWRLYVASFFRLIAAPLLTWVVCSLLTDDPALLMTAVIIGASPSAVMVSVLSIQYGRDGVFSSEGILQSTALSMLTIPLLVYILM